jgi:ABC-type sugar transport system permease subunit
VVSRRSVTIPHRRVSRGVLRRAEAWWGPLYALPAILVVLVFLGYPALSIAYHAFTRWNGYSAPAWIGIQNFQYLLQDPVFYLALRNNFLFAISVPIQLFLPLGLAFLIHDHVGGWRFYRWTYFLPAVYSTVVVGLLAKIILDVDGPLNEAIGAVGLPGLQANWLLSTQTSIPAILLVVMWANFGYNVVLYLAGMSGIDPDLPDAARIDGAGRPQVLRHVYVPALRRVMEIVLITSTIVAFASMFTYVYTITNGGPGFETYVTEFLIYNNAFTFQRMGYASAMGFVLTLIISSLSYFYIRALTGGRE